MATARRGAPAHVDGDADAELRDRRRARQPPASAWRCGGHGLAGRRRRRRASTSSRSTRPPGPLPVSAARSTPCSRASLRTAGDASLRRAPPRGSPRPARRSSRRRVARPHGLALAAHDPEQRPAQPVASTSSVGLVGLDLEQRLAARDLVADRLRATRRSSARRSSCPSGGMRTAVHQRQLPDRAARSARRSGTTACSSAGATGIGTSSAATRLTGASSAEEALVGRARRDLGAPAAGQRVLVDDHQPPGLAHRRPRASRRRAGAASAGRSPRTRSPRPASCIGRRERAVERDVRGDDGHVRARALHDGLAERDEVLLLRHLGASRSSPPACSRPLLP